MMQSKGLTGASLRRAALPLVLMSLLAACAAKEPLKQCEQGVADISATATLVPGNC